MGLLTEVVPAGAHLERALALAEGLASFPQRTMLADRRAAIEGSGWGWPRRARAGGRGRTGGIRRRRARRRALRRRRGPREGAGARGVGGRRARPDMLASCDGVLPDRSDRLHRTTPRRAAAQPASGQGVRARARELDGRLEDLIERWSIVAGASAAKRIQPVVGDLRRPLLGVEQERVTELRGKIAHFFHLAAVYDMTAPAELNTAVNVGGTTHAVELARALEAEHLHHVSSIAVAGDYRGTVRGGLLRRGPEAALSLPPDQVRGRADRARAAVRAVARVPPGDRGGRLPDRRDGQDRRALLLLQGDPADARRLLPEWVPLVGLDLGKTNVVPVDWVAGGARPHRASSPISTAAPST